MLLLFILINVKYLHELDINFSQNTLHSISHNYMFKLLMFNLQIDVMFNLAEVAMASTVPNFSRYYAEIHYITRRCRDNWRTVPLLR